MVEISEVKYGEWGNCVRVSDGVNELFATLDFGPRIIRFSAIGKENMFFEDKGDNINAEGMKKESEKYYGADKGVWHIRGGHRLWVSPEYVSPTYYPDNLPVSYEKIENGIILTPPPQKENGLQFSIEITMERENCVCVNHKIQNIGKENTKLSPWALTVLSPGGTEIFPVPDRTENVLENRHLVFWPSARMTDERVFWGDKYIFLRQDENAERNFKIGQLSQHGWAAYFNHGDVFVDHFETTEYREHPDRNCNFETYTCKYMLEMESLGEYKTLAPGETVEHKECWSYYCDVKLPVTEEEVDSFVKEIIE